MPYASALRGLNKSSMRYRIKMHNVHFEDKIDDKKKRNLETALKILTEHKDKFRFAVEGFRISCYTNDISLVDVISSIPDMDYMVLVQRLVNYETGTICLKCSDHDYRVYLKGGKITDDEAESLIQFVKTNEEHVQCSPSLAYWLSGSYPHAYQYYMYRKNIIKSHFFFDCKDENVLLFAKMCFGDRLKKVLKIVNEEIEHG